jgi:preprotein translocase subunit YajC
VQFLIIMALMLGVMYVLMIRPQRQRQAQQQAMISNAGVGDDVLTTGGIYGTITQVEDDDVVVEIAQGVTVHMTRRGIAAVLPPDEAEEEPADADEDEVDGELVAESEVDGDEGAVTDGEEAVRTAVGEASPGDDPR